MKNAKGVLISLGLAIFAVLLIFAYIQKMEQKYSENSTPMKIFVAAKDLVEGERLDESNTKPIDVPKKYVQPDAIQNPAVIIDRIVSVSLLEGTQILESMLATQEKAGLAQKIPKDKVAYTVAVNNVTGVAGLAQPGDYVDVLLSVDVGKQQIDKGVTDKETISKVVLENLLILAVDQRSYKISAVTPFTAPKGSPGSVFNPEGKGQNLQNPKISTITLAVGMDQCLRLNMAQEIGSLSIALRSTWNQGNKWDIGALDSHTFLGIEKPVLRKSLPAWVEIRGADEVPKF
jgi:pilus assembly protein CpaB